MRTVSVISASVSKKKCKEKCKVVTRSSGVVFFMVDDSFDFNSLFSKFVFITSLVFSYKVGNWRSIGKVLGKISKHNSTTLYALLFIVQKRFHPRGVHTKMGFLGSGQKVSTRGRGGGF